MAIGASRYSISQIHIIIILYSTKCLKRYFNAKMRPGLPIKANRAIACPITRSAWLNSCFLRDGCNPRTESRQLSSTGSFLVHQYFFNPLASNGDFSTADYLPQQFLYFLPLPQGQGPLREGFPTIVSFGFSVGSSNKEI